MSVGKARVLIVDDEPSIRSLLSLIISEHGGFPVSRAEDGPSALRSIQLDAPDILLADLNMPGMTGWELIAAVRADYPAVRVIAMSGTRSDDASLAGSAADGFFLKDGRNWNDLLQTLEALSREAYPPGVRSSGQSLME